MGGGDQRGEPASADAASALEPRNSYQLISSSGIGPSVAALLHLLHLLPLSAKRRRGCAFQAGPGGNRGWGGGPASAIERRTEGQRQRTTVPLLTKTLRSGRWSWWAVGASSSPSVRSPDDCCRGAAATSPVCLDGKTELPAPPSLLSAGAVSPSLRLTARLSPRPRSRLGGGGGTSPPSRRR